MTTVAPGTGPVSARPADEPRLLDRHGRVATDLRISLTDRCNLRCTYCMPPEGLPWLPTPSLLTDDEVVRLAQIAVEHLGVDEIRYTGGEPLLRPGLVKIVEGSRERVQAFEGVCIARRNRGLNSSFTVRKISYGEGVERVFPLHSPRLVSIELVRRGDVRRAKLYYLRGRRGKAARITEKAGPINAGAEE